MTVLVDTSVWIDLFADRHTVQTRAGRDLIGRGERILVGDLVLVEVLQGTRDRHDFDRKQALLSGFDPMAIVDPRIALQAARNYQHLRALGITIRKTIDTLIATRCILDDIALLYADRDFDPFVDHLGLRSALTMPGAL
ncbi:PIN domain nuclease [Sphingomonas sp. 1P08PE]|uniref:type II toxin-antitoxin system VapC family toxin n=1 Tax=Sphingomonas sp. 1P08PE TaxID=554122 RepID=UPI0039A17266